MKMKNIPILLLLLGLVAGLFLTSAIAGEKNPSKVSSQKQFTIWSKIPDKYVTKLQVFRHFYSTGEDELCYEIQLVLIDETTLGHSVSSLLRSLLRPGDRDVPYVFLVRLYKPPGAKGGEIRLREKKLHIMVNKTLYGLHGQFSLIGERGIYGLPDLTRQNPSELVVFVPSRTTTEALKKALEQKNKIRIYYEDTQGAELKLPE